MPAPQSDRELLAELDALEAESELRRRELREIAQQLPHAISRRRLLASIVGDLRQAPNKPEIVRRAIRKVMRVPSGARRRLRRRFGGHAG